MTLPQDTRSPHRAQRFIELKNIGSATIPPFGVVEIAGSYRPEQTDQYTPNDGRTVMLVRLATKDSPCATIVNFACEIPPGEERRIGTMDDPLLALVDDPSYTVGTVVGVEAGSFVLTRDHCGYMIIGDYDAGTGTMRVKRWEECQADSMMVEALECITPGTLDGLAQPLVWDSDAQEWSQDQDVSSVTICDPNCWLMVLPGEQFKVERMRVCNQDAGSGTTGNCYQPSFPYGLRRKVRIKSRLDCGESGTATVLIPTEVGSGGSGEEGSCEPYPSGCSKYWLESDCDITVCNDGNRKIACDVECEDAWAETIPGYCMWSVTPGQRAMIATATAGSSVCGSEATITGIEYRDVCDWKATPEPSTAGNDLEQLACEGDKLLLYWDEMETCVWKIASVQTHQYPHMLTEAKCNDDGTCGASITQTKGMVAVQQCVDCDTTEPAELGIGEVEVVTGATVTYEVSGGTEEGCDPEGGELTINLTTTKICVICPAGTSGGGSQEGTPVEFPLKLNPVDALTDVLFECDPDLSITPSATMFYAFCVGTETTLDAETPCDYYDCDEGSGSGI